MKTFILTIFVLAQITDYHAAVDTKFVGITSMSFTVETRVLPTSKLESRIIGRFTDSAWNSLWDELQISKQQWEDWQSLQVNVPLLPDFPEISKLAYIDEGVVHFRPKELNEECVHLLETLNGEATRELVESLLKASNLAMQSENIEVIVHPFPA